MKNLTVSAFLFVLAGSAAAATVSSVSVTQMKPWSSKVKVDYELQDVSGPTDIRVEFYSGATKLAANIKYALKGDDFYGVTTSGKKSFSFEPKEVFGEGVLSYADFKVKLTAVDSPANANEVIYKIFTLPTAYQGAMPCENVTRADILNGKYGTYETDYGAIGPGFKTSLDDVLIWTGVTNDIAYKTSKLVMRKIPAADKSFLIGGSAADAAKAEVRFGSDYWMSVFEMTCYQHRLLYRLTNSSYSYSPYENSSADRTAVISGSITVSDICAADRLSPVAACGGNWPERQHSTIGTWNPCWHLKKSSGLLFDLPTSAEWEFSARAGTTTALPSGKDFSAANMAEIARSYGINCKIAQNHPDYKDVSPKPEFPPASCGLDYGCTIVGSYRPNAYGLYDMMGNALEACLDYYNSTVQPFGGTDPKGPTSPGATTYGAQRVIRGGSYRYQFQDVGFIGSGWSDWRTEDFGYRICLHEVDK